MKHPILVKTNNFQNFFFFLKTNVPRKEQIFYFKKDGRGCLEICNRHMLIPRSSLKTIALGKINHENKNK